MSQPIDVLCMVGRDDRREFIKPCAPCTAALCALIKQHVDAISAENTRELYVDLSQATRLDSTFAGFLVSLATGRRSAGQWTVYLVAPSDQAVTSLNGMHILSLFGTCNHLPCETVDWQPLVAGKADADKLGNLIVDAHEGLIDADERNRGTFGPVVDSFKDEQRRRRSQGPEQ